MRVSVLCGLLIAGRLSARRAAAEAALSAGSPMALAMIGGIVVEPT
jgi:hypothetical protein